MALDIVGNTGIAVMLYDPRRSNISKIERESGVKFEHISAPQPADIAKAVGADAAKLISQVSDEYVSCLFVVLNAIFCLQLMYILHPVSSLHSNLLRRIS